MSHQFAKEDDQRLHDVLVDSGADEVFDLINDLANEGACADCLLHNAMLYVLSSYVEMNGTGPAKALLDACHDFLDERERPQIVDAPTSLYR